VISGNIGLSLQDQITNLEAFSAKGGSLSTKAKDLADKLRKKLHKDLYDNLQNSMMNMSLPDQITTLTTFGAANPQFSNIVTSEIRKRQKQIDNTIKNTKKRLFDRWMQDLQLEPLQKQFEELNSFIKTHATSGGSDELRQAALQREKVRKAINSEKARQQQSKSLNARNNIMLAAGAGLGLLGPAGFPLLNVGFAAMSGGVPGAVIVGFSTALGQSIQALEKFSATTEAVARELKFVPHSLTKKEGQEKGIDAVFGAAALASRQAGINAFLIRSLSFCINFLISSSLNFPISTPEDVKEGVAVVLPLERYLTNSCLSSSNPSIIDFHLCACKFSGRAEAESIFLCKSVFLELLTDFLISSLALLTNLPPLLI